MTIKKQKEIDVSRPDMPSRATAEDVAAIQAVSRGDANAHQQRHALLFIVEVLARTYDTDYRAGGHEGDRATCFAGGKRFVGQQIVKLTKTNLDLYRSDPK